MDKGKGRGKGGNPITGGILSWMMVIMPSGRELWLLVIHCRTHLTICCGGFSGRALADLKDGSRFCIEKDNLCMSKLIASFVINYLAYTF